LAIIKLPQDDIHPAALSIDHFFHLYKDFPDSKGILIFQKNSIGQITVEQKPFTTEPLRRGVSPLFFSVASCLRGSKNVQPIADYYNFPKTTGLMHSVDDQRENIPLLSALHFHTHFFAIGDDRDPAAAVCPQE
jgi:hypothetical protein